MLYPFIWILPVFIIFILFFVIVIGASIFNIVFFLIALALFPVFLFYVFGIDVITSVTLFIKEIFETVEDKIEYEKEKQPKPPVPEIKIAPQVFNIPANIFTYQDARALCSAYGARLANYSEIEEAYNKGGEWCNYGWSENQQILFPTQKATYDKLQGIKGHQNDCGRQGINGGYIGNPHARFGVNCYGYKPEITTVEQQMMENATSPYPLNAEDLVFQKKVDILKRNLNNIIISPFNSSYWSKLL